jgi:prepilin-type N-terminal cleavage/methylation domain-containing protein
MLKTNSKDQKGFTIIEVLIVLAIAGLILLIVFLAVPALQRNSRNTQRRADVATYGGAVSEFVTNNNGTKPSTAPHVATINGLAKTSGNTTKPTDVLTGARTNTVALDSIELVTDAKCSTTSAGDTVDGTSRTIALRFSVENATNTGVKQCQEI